MATQNGNAYDAGFVDEAWKPFWAYAADPNPQTARPLVEGLSLARIRSLPAGKRTGVGRRVHE
jgi:hypothetical protein